MIDRIAPVLVLLGALGFIGCQSANPPIAPSPVPQSSVLVPPGSQEGAGAPTFIRPPDTGPIVIEHGEIEVDKSTLSSHIRLRGNRGFSLNGYVDILSSLPIWNCTYSPCIPGTVISLNAWWVDTGVVSTVTLDGTTYRTGAVDAMAHASIEVIGSVVAPLMTKRGEDRVTAPFTMSGRLSVDGTEGTPVVNVTFTGEGVATVWLGKTADFDAFYVDRLVYRFKHRP